MKEHALKRRVEALESEIELLHDRVLSLLKANRTDTPAAEYAWFVERFVRRLQDVVRPGAAVLVVSKGDDRLLALPSAKAAHFPQDDKGDYAGAYPADDVSAIAHVEALRQEGYDTLVVPAFSSWWLEYYEGFARHLADRYAQVVADKVCRVFDLSVRAARQAPSLAGQLEQVLLEARRRIGRVPDVLDWGTTADVGRRCPEYAVISTTADHVSYLDQSIDVVVIPVERARVVDEARRVASAAVVIAGADRVINVEWLVDARQRRRGGAVTVVALRNGRMHDPRWTLANEVEASCGLDTLASSSDRATVNALSETGAVDAVRLELPDASAEDVLVFVNAGAALLPGCVAQLVGALNRFGDAGAVGGRIVDGAGRVVHAGGAVLADAAILNVGEGDWRTDDPRYTHTRAVDFSSSSCMATTRRAFEEVGGFDTSLPVGLFRDADFGLRLRERGHAVYYNPESVAVCRGALAPVNRVAPVADHERRWRQLFAARWKGILQARPASLEVWGA